MTGGKILGYRSHGGGEDRLDLDPGIVDDFVDGLPGVVILLHLLNLFVGLAEAVLLKLLDTLYQFNEHGTGLDPGALEDLQFGAGALDAGWEGGEPFPERLHRLGGGEGSVAEGLGVDAELSHPRPRLLSSHTVVVSGGGETAHTALEYGHVFACGLGGERKGLDFAHGETGASGDVGKFLAVVPEGFVGVERGDPEGGEPGGSSCHDGLSAGEAGDELVEPNGAAEHHLAVPRAPLEQILHAAEGEHTRRGEAVPPSPALLVELLLRRDELLHRDAHLIGRRPLQPERLDIRLGPRADLVGRGLAGLGCGHLPGLDHALLSLLGARLVLADGVAEALDGLVHLRHAAHSPVDQGLVGLHYLAVGGDHGGGVDGKTEVVLVVGHDYRSVYRNVEPTVPAWTVVEDDSAWVSVMSMGRFAARI